MRSSLKHAIELFPLTTLVYVFISYFYLESYYGCFGIKIINYVHYSEILFALVPALYGLLFYSISYVVGVTSGRPRPMSDSQREHHDKLPYITYRHFPLLPSDMKLVMAVGWSMCLLGLSVNVIGVKHLYELHDSYVSFVGFCCGLVLFTILPFVSPTKSRTFMFVSIIVIIGVLFFALLGSRRLEAEYVQHNPTKSKVQFTYGDRTIKTDSLSYPVGETTDYLFFYNKKFKQTSVYKRSEMDSLVIKLP